MTDTDMDNIYKQRIARIETTVNHNEPDIVPILANLETWAISYNGKRSMDVLGITEQEFACFKKVFTDFYFDATILSFLTRDVRMYDSLGNSSYFYSSDGVTLQHKETCLMEADEYDLLIKDPSAYTKDIYFKKKYPSFNKEYPESYNAIKTTLDVFLKFIAKAKLSNEYYIKNCGMPTLRKSIGVMPLDIIMDYYRGLAKVLIDIRRFPDKVAKAAEALYTVSFNDITRGEVSLPGFPYIFFPMHIPTYLRPKQFEQCYWPTFKRMIDTLTAMGAKSLMFIEGSWEHLYDFINELPKDATIAILDRADIFKAKKEIGATTTIGGGIDLKQLKYGTKDECIDRTKELIDEIAPGGGFIFTTTQTLLAPNDVNIENFKAVNQYMHENGKY